MVDESKHGLPKLVTTCQTATVILADNAARVHNILETIVRDEEHLTRLDGILAERKEQTLRQVGGFLRGIEQACRRCETEGQQLLERNLSFWRTWRLVFGKSEWQEKFQADLENKMRDLIQPQVENALQLLETDLRSLWPQLQDTIENQFKGDSRVQLSQTMPDFARQRRELLQSIELTLVERIAGRGMEAQLERMFRETATWLRVPAGSRRRGRHRDRDCRHEQRRGGRCDRDRRRFRRRRLARLSPSDVAEKFSPNITGKWKQNGRSWSRRSSSNCGMRSTFSTPRSAPFSNRFAPSAPRSESATIRF